MNLIRTTAFFSATLLALAGWLAVLAPTTALVAQEKKAEVKAGGKKGALDVGPLNLKKLTTDDLTPPAKDDKIVKVGIRATISGQVAKDEKLNVYLAVCPIGSADAKGSFWIQKAVKRDGEKFKGECQFGEGDAGKGEFFAVVGITSKNEFADGEQVDIAALQKAATSYSAVLIVKRKD
jgi:hypothetical protein